MEVAIRLLKLIFLKALLVLMNRDAREISEAIQEHYRHVALEWRFTKACMMGGNHLIVELASIAAHEFMTGDSGRACDMLRKEVKRQFLPDGGYFEGSVGYHAYIINALSLVQWLAYAAGVQKLIPSSVMQSAIQFLELLEGPEGSAPGIGDWDDGYLFRPFEEKPRCVRGLIRFCRGVVRENIDKPSSSSDDWTFLSYSGMAVHRSDNEGLMCFRAATVVHGHSHLDMLSLHFIGSDGPIILDGGTYAYNYSRESRDVYRSTKSHSTVLGPSFLPLKPFRNFAWKGTLECKLWKKGNRVFGEYSVKRIGKFRREVRFTGNGYEIIDDCPEGSNSCVQYIIPAVEITENGVLGKSFSGRGSILISCSPESVFPTVRETSVSMCYGSEIKVEKVVFPINRSLITRIRILD
jgi:hypothetical protein